MPRRSRTSRDGELHHVVIRGHSGSPIVTHSDDAAELVARLARALTLHGVLVWVWALLSNHMHMVLAARIAAISWAMHHALGPYGRQLNSRTGGSGAFFEDRFWARPIEDDNHASNTLPYVILNTLTAGLAKSLDELESHAWCGYGALLGKCEPRLPTDLQAPLHLYGPSRATAIRVLQRRLVADEERWRRDVKKPTLEGIIRIVASEVGLPEDVLRSGSRHRWVGEARATIVGRAVALGLPQSRIAHALGVDRSTVSRLARGPREVACREAGWEALAASRRLG